MYKVFLSSQINTTEWETVTLRAKNTEHTGVEEVLFCKAVTDMNHDYTK